MNVLAKFENDPWKITDVIALTGLHCLAARPTDRPLGRRQYPGALKGCGLTNHLLDIYRAQCYIIGIHCDAWRLLLVGWLRSSSMSFRPDTMATHTASQPRSRARLNIPKDFSCLEVPQLRELVLMSFNFEIWQVRQGFPGTCRTLEWSEC